MLYLSRMDPSRDPKKTRLDTADEQKRRSLAQLGVKEGDDTVAEQEVGGVTSRLYCHIDFTVQSFPRNTSIGCNWDCSLCSAA